MYSNVGKASPLKRLPQGAKASPMNRLLRGAIVLAGVCLFSGAAVAAQPQGKWSGLVQQANSDVSAQLVFTPDKVDVHFDEPFACNVPAKFLKDGDAGAAVYRFGVSTNGGKFCQDLQGRDLTFKPGKDGRLAIDFASAKTTWHGDLKPSSAVPAQP